MDQLDLPFFTLPHDVCVRCAMAQHLQSICALLAQRGCLCDARRIRYLNPGRLRVDCGLRAVSHRSPQRSLWAMQVQLQYRHKPADAVRYRVGMARISEGFASQDIRRSFEGLLCEIVLEAYDQPQAIAFQCDSTDLSSMLIPATD